VCSAYLGNEDSQPRWAPDGTKFTYADSQGVWVASAPVRAGGGSCAIGKTLIAPGGEAPDWGPANLPAMPDPGTGGDVSPPGDNRPPADVVPPAIAKAALGKGRLATLLSKGYAVSFITNEGGTATVQLLSGKTVVANGKGSVKAGARATIKAKFTKKARASLKRKRSVKLTLKIVVKDAAGNPNAQTKRVTLKR
jgi:hypothetical protein